MIYYSLHYRKSLKEAYVKDDITTLIYSQKYTLCKLYN